MNAPQKIKLLIFIPTLECGGTEGYVSLLCNHMDVERFDISLVVLNNSHPFYKISNRVELIDLKIQHVRKALFPVKKIIKQKQPDIIYTTANHLNILFATFRWMFPKNIKIIARESSIVSINSRRAKFPALYTRLIKLFYKRIDLIICQSAFMQKDLTDHFHIPCNKTRVINNPVEEINIPEELSNSTVKKDKVFKFITVSRLSPEKGIERLLRSVALFAKPYKYYIIGEGKQRKDIENLIILLGLEGKVILTGEKLNPYHHMQDADLFLMGSQYEGFPNVLLEAGVLGIPVIAFDAPGGIPEIIEEGVNGLLVKENDEKAFSFAIEKAVQMNFDRYAIIEKTKARYGINRIVSITRELFLSMLQGSFEQ